LLYLFEDYALDTDRRELRRRNGLLAVAPKVFDLLAYVIGNRDRVVSKGELLAAIWEARIVSESALTTCINAARSVIADSGQAQRLIKTIPRKGIRFVGTVREGKRPVTVADGLAEPSLTLPNKPSIAVLPFQSISGDANQEYFADGIVEDIVTQLSKSRELLVIARNSTFTFKGPVVDLKQIARELGVRYVLEGSVRKAGKRIRVTAQLVEAATSGHIWADRYDRGLGDILAMQDEITMSVSAAILPAVERAERERVARKPPDNLDARECYHRALWHVSKVEAEENALALGFFDRAIELDPCFAAAHAAKSFALEAQAAIFRPQAERQTWLPRATEHARRAIGIDHADALGHSSLAVTLVHAGRHEEAFAEADLALSLDSNSSRAYFCMGFTQAFGGQPREAIASLMRAMRLSPFDPLTPLFLNMLARACYHMEDYPVAVARARQLCRSFPNFQNPYRTLIAALGQTGEAAEAQAVMADALERFGADFRTLMAPLRTTVHEDRVETRELMRDGYRKAGVLDEGRSRPHARAR
jgi:TolB-like protein/Tfp pilus assembly protein PilF